MALGANRSLDWGNLADAYRWTPGRRADSIGTYERAIALLRDELVKQTTELAGNRDRALHWLAQAVKAGYPVKEISSEPELTALRADARYHRLIATLPTPKEQR